MTRTMYLYLYIFSIFLVFLGFSLSNFKDFYVLGMAQGILLVLMISLAQNPKPPKNVKRK